jgi:hypothetical protein
MPKALRLFSFVLKNLIENKQQIWEEYFKIIAAWQYSGCTTAA